MPGPVFTVLAMAQVMWKVIVQALRFFCLSSVLYSGGEGD